MTAAAQAAGDVQRADEALLKAYLASRPEDHPIPEKGQPASDFFAAAFVAGAPGEGFCTGYYEPEIAGALRPHGAFVHPIYRKPADLTADAPYFDRAAINQGALAGRGLEIAWLSDPVEAFFLHVQGSGRIRLEDGQVLRVGFAGKNGRPYRSIGKTLVEKGNFAREDVTAQSLKDWLAAHPEDAGRVMNENPSYVFFETRSHLGAEDGPIGTARASLTPLISVAADPDHHPLGAVLHLEHDPAAGLKSGFAIVQDTGGAIKGANRIDVFTGSGDTAGMIAGALKHPVRVTMFTPGQGPT